jgi:hypothetical protein
MDRATAALAQLAVTSLALPEDGQVRLATFRAGTGLRLPDCCALLAAEQWGGSIATFGARLGAAAAQLAFKVRGR